MEEPLPVLESPPNARLGAPPPAPMSFTARLLNVFAIPGEVFETVRASRICVANWLLPALLSAVVGALTISVILSQPSVQRQGRDLSEQQAKALDQQVKAGKVTRGEGDPGRSGPGPGGNPVVYRSRHAQDHWQHSGGPDWRRPHVLVGAHSLAGGASVFEGAVWLSQNAGGDWFGAADQRLGQGRSAGPDGQLDQGICRARPGAGGSGLRGNPEKQSDAGRQQRLCLLAGGRALRRAGQACPCAVPACRVVCLCLLGYPGVLAPLRGRSAGTIRTVTGALPGGTPTPHFVTSPV